MSRMCELKLDFCEKFLSHLSQAKLGRATVCLDCVCADFYLSCSWTPCHKARKHIAVGHSRSDICGRAFKSIQYLWTVYHRIDKRTMFVRLCARVECDAPSPARSQNCRFAIVLERGTSEIWGSRLVLFPKWLQVTSDPVMRIEQVCWIWFCPFSKLLLQSSHFFEASLGAKSCSKVCIIESKEISWIDKGDFSHA